MRLFIIVGFFLLIHSLAISQEVVMKNYRNEDGLPSNQAFHVMQDSKGYIWIGTDKGVSRFDGYEFKNFSSKDGLGGTTILDIYQDKKKGTNKKPKAYIDDVSVSKTSDGNHLVNYPNNTISFKYTPLVYYHDKDLLYRYRISGLSGEGQYTTSNNVFYPFIPEGHYHFEIAVKDKNGFWGGITHVPFIIETPYWKTTWFLVFIITILIIIVSAIILLIIINRRIKEQAKHEIIKYQQKALSNQMNPHFLFNSLNSIHRYLLENNSIFASKYLSKFARLMRLFLNNSEKETIVIRKEIESIRLYLELENLRMKNAFEFNVHIDKNIDADKMHVPAMLLQPIVENSVIHGIRYLRNSIGLIELSFIKENNSLKIIITDNGVGRDKALEIEHKDNHKSHGGSIVRKRIKLLNQLYRANIAIIYLDLHGEDSQNKGTKVIIKNIPINLKKNDKSIDH